MTSLTLTGVPQTLLIPLVARAYASRWIANTRFHDPGALDLLDRLLQIATIQDREAYLAAIQRERTLLQACVLRAECVDQLVQNDQARALKENRRLLIVSLGAGLCTRARRLASPLTRWVELDLPEVITIRNELDPISPNDPIHRHAGSLFDLSWLDGLRLEENEDLVLLSEGVLLYFPRHQVEDFFFRLAEKLQSHPSHPKEVRFYFDSLHPLPLKLSRLVSASIQKTGARLQWGLAHSTDLESLHRSYQVNAPVDLSGRTPGVLGWGQRLLRVGMGQSFYQIQRLTWMRLSR